MNIIQNKLLKFYLIIAFGFFFSLSSKASHVAGLDLTYKHVSGNSYEITVVLYRDCSGASEPGSFNIRVGSSVTGQIFSTHSLNKVSGSGQIISSACNGLSTTCDAPPGSQPAIRKWEYRGIIDLGSQRSDWEISATLSYRNASIDNIVSPGSTDCSVSAKLNNLNGPNDSPTFTNDPFAFLCFGQNFNFNHGVTDANGDNLSYSFIVPQTAPGGNSPITYANGYSLTDPLGTLNGTTVTINPSNGDININPNNLITGVMAVQIVETKNGVVVGSVVRDMQFWVTNNCGNNSIPSASGINNTSSYSTSICVGQQLCFDIHTSDGDASQNVTLSWNNAIAGATFTQTSGPRPVGHFCWTPTASDMGTHTFTVLVKDNACPSNGFQVFSYSILVNCNNDPCNPPKCPAGVKFSYSPVVSPGMVKVNQPITFTNTSVCNGSATYLWEFKNLSTGTISNSSTQNPSYTFTAPGLYTVKLSITIQGCTASTLKLVRAGEELACENCIGSFAPTAGKYILSAWVKEENAPPTKLSYTQPEIKIFFPTSTTNIGTVKYTCTPSGDIIDGWQRIETEIEILPTDKYINIQLNSKSGNCFFDDVRIFPKDGNMISYVYDPLNLRLMAELDERNYATLFEYDEEGKLIRVKKETEKGIMTIKENKNSTKKQ